MKLSLRTRLLGSFVVVIVIYGAIATVVGVRMIGDGIIKQAQSKVGLDLNSARVIYQQDVSEVRCSVRHTAGRFFIRDALAAGEVDTLGRELEKIRLAESLDVFSLIGPRGATLLRARNPAAKGDGQGDNELIRRAISSRAVAASTRMVTGDELLKEGGDLAEQAHLRLAPTPKAKPTTKTEETSGMMIAAAAPVLENGGRLLGVLYGGRLLNRNYGLVDKIKDTVYQGEVYDGRDIGTATIFQGDLRISTNVRTEGGERAIGTRVSAEVNERVLVEGKPWVERAFVVNAWYITAYEPIRNISGEVIGILYVGMLERKFADLKAKALWGFIGISLGGIALSVAICLLLSRTLIKPMDALAFAAEQLAAGDLRGRVEPDDSTVEIETLGRTFNLMASSIEERDERLRQRAQEEIMKSERLAMIGRLAAGVAHEINNPLGGILLFSRLLLRKAPVNGTDKENLERIAKEAERCQKIVQGLLDFARQREPRTESVSIDDVLEMTISLLENQALFHNIEIVRQFQERLPDVRVDSSQMQQVFVNIIMNAAEAMDSKGTLTITTTADRVAGLVKVSFSDTGCGISQEAMERLFEPFFTTKEVGRGTGLGLSISHGIVERHGGTLSTTSRPEEGATFVVSLPVDGEKA